MAALVLVLLTAAWGARGDIVEVRRVVLDAEITRLRSHARRTVGRIEDYLEGRPGERGLASLHDVAWLREFWHRVVPQEDQRLYAALVDDSGLVIMHSDPGQQGKRVERRWFERRIPTAGEDVVETRSNTLAHGRLAYDIQVPVEINGEETVTYHSGFDARWLENAVADQQRGVYIHWGLIGGVIVCIVLAGGVSLFHLARRTAALQQALGMARTQQLTELGRLAGALAHEIRNPLNAIRLNLHALRRYLGDTDVMPREELATVLNESNDEIERLEGLVRSLLGYARPEQARVADVELCQELEGIVSFLGQLIDQNNVTLHTHLPDESIVVHMDRDRFRQIMLNLLNNAREAVGLNGEISVSLHGGDGWAEIIVADTGRGVPAEDRSRIFEPFYTTKETGCGLGLSLVKRFTEEAGGMVSCEQNGDRGTRFKICLPEIAQTR